jgi:hypothetical protein
MPPIRGRATWIWRTGDIICSAEKVDQFALFAESNHIRRVYIHINPDLSCRDFERFVSRCATSEIAVEALMGDPEWVRNPHHESFEHRIAWVREYQSAHAHVRELQISGLHLDIEVS